MSAPAVAPPGPVDAARLDRLGVVFTRAFGEYPLFQELFPEPGARARALRWYMQFIIRYAHRYGTIVTTDRDEAVLAYLTADQQVTRRKLVAAGLLAGPLRMGLAPFRRMIRYNNHVAHLSSRLVPAGAWYAWMLGVEQAARSRGLGRRLMTHFTLAADAAGAAGFADTDRPGIADFVAPHGFRVVAEGRTPDGLPYWIFFRPPRRQPDQPGRR